MGTAYYKILIDGRSAWGGTLTWSLPRNGKPGEWHEVDGPLVQCRNGLHLTSEPTCLRRPKTVCYEAEYEGDTIGPDCRGELVARKVRLLRRVQWSAFKSPDEPEPEPKAESPAMTLLAHTWKSEGHGQGKSWRRLNDAMQKALNLAISCGFRFARDDFAEIAKRFNPGFWLHIEEVYAQACGHGHRAPHGDNPSAYQAMEAYLKRKPFIVAEKPDGPRVRLCVGRRFSWHVDLKDRVQVTVTSFAADQSHAIACSYKDGVRSKIDRRFKITHDDIAEYHAALREHAKKAEEKMESPS